MTDPPKKKHVNRPRPAPVLPWTDAERAESAALEFAKATRHLNEAERIIKRRDVPLACVHLAYYAMHHCARAVILVSGGAGKLKNAPDSHRHVLEHFDRLTSGEIGDLGKAGATLSRAMGLREAADYGLDRDPSAADADEAVAEARVFMDACAKRWNLAG
jgi:uncharacterized protein (UPF0332 family)